MMVLGIDSVMRIFCHCFLTFLLPVFCLAQSQTGGSVPVKSPSPQPFFSNLAAETGLDFTHFNGMTGKLYLPEIMGSGAALFDYDNDGDMDVFFVQGRVLEPGKGPKDAVFPWESKDAPMGRLFRNDLKIANDGTRTIEFTDVTQKSGINADGYGFGVATGDINNDGFVDLYICNLESNKLFLNSGDGTFKDVTASSKTDDTGWSIGASFFDYDRDGWLDLYVVNYGDFDIKRKQPLCYSKTTARDYCGPKAYNPVGNTLFRNRGDGTFENVSGPSKINTEKGHSLGVVTADLNADGLPDIYVANDGDPNEVWINRGNGQFENEGYFSGAAVNKEGKSEASMGIDAGDINLDGNLDLFITHLMEETHTLYINEGDAVFEDITTRTNLGLPDVRLTGFGTSLFDYDNDGLLDVFIANGSVKLLKEVFRPGNAGELDPKYPLGQRNQLFRNAGTTKFEDVSSQAGESFAEKNVSRGAAFGDIDNDGDIDIVVVNNSGKAELLVNMVGSANRWIGLRLTNRKSGRDLYGAKIEILLESGRTLHRRVRTDGSYGSAHDPRVAVGLGGSGRIKSVKIIWPDGTKGLVTDPVAGKYSTVSFGAETGK